MNHHQQDTERYPHEQSVSSSATQNPSPSSTKGEDVHIRNIYTGPTLPHQDATSHHPAYMLIRALFGIALAIALAMFVRQYQHASSPYSNLLSFAIKEAKENDVSSIYDLKTDDIDIYAQGACAEGDTPADVRSALYAQLSKIPKEVRDSIVRQAVIDRVSTSSAHQNTKASVSTNGKAHSYMAFWSTAYNGEMTAFSAKYTTCVMLSGIELSIAEQLAGSETTREMQQIGTRPCECGFLGCARCPIIEPYVVHTPIFKRHALTIKQQIELHRFMVKHATDQAKRIVGNRQSIGGYFGNMRQISDNLASLKWRGPNKNAFLGSDVGSGGSDDVSGDGLGEEIKTDDSNISAEE